MKKRLLSVLLILIFSIFLFGNDSVTFSRITLEDGLSHSRIYAIYQDSDGFLWIGTSNGLNRYDGRDFKIYKHDAQDPLSLPHNYVTSIIEDFQGYLWVGTNGGGLAKLDRRSGQFEVYNSSAEDESKRIDDDHVWGLMEDSEHQLWIGTSYSGIYILDQKRSHLEHIQAGPEGYGLSDNNVWPILEDRNGDVWIGTDGGGLTRWVKSSGELLHYRSDENDHSSISSNYIFSLYLDHEDNLWVGTSGGGLNLFNRNTHTFKAYTHNEEDNSSISFNTVRSMYEDSKNRFWIGTTDGLNLFDKETGTFKQMFHLPDDEKSLSHSRIHCITEDSSGVLWFGTRDGLNKYIESSFESIFIQGDGEDFLRRNDIRSMYPLNEEALLVGAYKGLYFLNGEKQTELFSEDIIYSIFMHSSGDFYLGGQDALYRMQFEDENQFSIQPLHKMTVNKIVEDTQHRLWIATEYSGLALYSPEEDSLQWFTPEDATINRLYDWSISDLLFYSDDELLVASNSYPLLAINSKTLSIQKPSEPLFQSLKAYFLYKASDTLYYFGIDQNGLNRVNTEKQTIDVFTENDGLPSDFIRGLIAVENELWISTLRGIARLDSEDQIVSFGIEDGLNSLIFNPGAVAQTGNKELLFGSTSGIAKIDTADVQYNQFSPQLAVEIFNSLQKELNIYNKEGFIHLSASHRLLVLKLSAFDYSHPGKIKYAYRFSDQEEWVELGNHGEMVFSYLAPGKYTLLLKATNSDGVWMETPKSISIVVDAPLLLRWYAFLIYFLLLLLAVFLFYRQRSKRHIEIIKSQEYVVAQRTQELEQAKLALEQEIEKKSYFFINLAHETKTPLTFIQNYMNRYIQKHGSDENLDQVVSNVNKLVRDMVNYLDSEKLNQNETIYNHSQICSLSNEINAKKPLLNEAVRKKSIKIRYSVEENLLAAFDPLAFDRILNNLVDNAIKYSDTKATISISLVAEDNKIRFSVSDTGKGMSKEQREHIFDPFFQISQRKDHNQGVGMGLSIVKRIVEETEAKLSIDTVENEGSTFTITIPLYTEVSESANIVTYEGRQSYAFNTLVPHKPEDTSWRPDKKSIILVDDDNAMLHLLSDTLSSLYNLRFFNSAEELLARTVEMTEPDLIISDVMLNGMDGHTLLSKLQDTDWCSVAFIFLSAKSERSEQLQGIYEGAVDFIEKPFKVELLLERINARIRGQVRRREMLLRSVQNRLQKSFIDMKYEHNESIEEAQIQNFIQAINLTEREAEVLEQILEGKVNKEIADKLNISVRTVERHVYNVFKKAKVQNRIELIKLFQKP